MCFVVSSLEPFPFSLCNFTVLSFMYQARSLCFLIQCILYLYVFCIFFGLENLSSVTLNGFHAVDLSFFSFFHYTVSSCWSFQGIPKFLIISCQHILCHFALFYNFRVGFSIFSLFFCFHLMHEYFSLYPHYSVGEAFYRSSYLVPILLISRLPSICVLFIDSIFRSLSILFISFKCLVSFLNFIKELFIL